MIPGDPAAAAHLALLRDPAVRDELRGIFREAAAEAVRAVAAESKESPAPLHVHLGCTPANARTLLSRHSELRELAVGRAGRSLVFYRGAVEKWLQARKSIPQRRPRRVVAK
jgi:hypothetical protein